MTRPVLEDEVIVQVNCADQMNFNITKTIRKALHSTWKKGDVIIVSVINDNELAIRKKSSTNSKLSKTGG